MSPVPSSLQLFFSAKSIAIIGASREPQKVGYQILKNLQQNSKLKLFPINPKANSIRKLQSYPSILDVDSTIDVAVIAVPVQFIQPVIQECIQKKVKAVVVVTAGFSESSASGKKAQADLIEQLKHANIALLGPNTLGLINPYKNLNASFAGQGILEGSTALISQSGAMLTALFDTLSSQNLGCSFAVSLGNKAGISEIEALEFAAEDPHTKYIALYLESFTNLPEFFRLTSQISKRKPVVVLKGGRSKQGQTASLSHTAALATNYELLKSAQYQMGYVLVDTVEEFIRTIQFFEQQKSLPENVMIVTNAGGPGVNTVDLVSHHGIELAKWSAKSKDHIEDLEPKIKVSNPLDVLGDANADRFKIALLQLQRDVNIDAGLFIITQQAVTDIPEIVEMFCENKGKKPVFISVIGGDALEKFRKKLREHGYTCAEFPSDLIPMLNVSQQLSSAQFRQQFFPEKILPQNPITADFDLSQAFELLKEYQFEIPAYYLANEENAVKNFKFPLYAKTANLQLKHKKKVGAVFGLVNTLAEARNAYEKLSKFGNQVLYQHVVEGGVELLLGVRRDDQFGLYLACGLGGSDTDVFSDRQYIFLPATKKQLREAFEQTMAYKLLVKEADTAKRIPQVVDQLMHLQRLILEHQEIVELEINPLIVTKHDCWAVDVKVSSL